MESYHESLHRSEVTKYRKECAALMTGRVLDVGGGLGAYLPYFRADHVTVLDNDEETLRRLEHEDKILGDATNLPFPDDSFDNIWACAVCQYFDLDRFVMEAKRVLKKNDDARIFILVPNAKSPWEPLKRLLGAPTWSDQKGVYKQYSADDLRKYGKVTGEIRFLPFEGLFRSIPSIGNTLMLEICGGEVILVILREQIVRPRVGMRMKLAAFESASDFTLYASAGFHGGKANVG